MKMEVKKHIIEVEKMFYAVIKLIKNVLGEKHLKQLLVSELLEIEKKGV